MAMVRDEKNGTNPVAGAASRGPGKEPKQLQRAGVVHGRLVGAVAVVGVAVSVIGLFVSDDRADTATLAIAIALGMVFTYYATRWMLLFQMRLHGPGEFVRFGTFFVMGSSMFFAAFLVFLAIRTSATR